MTELTIGDIDKFGVIEIIRAIAPSARNGDDAAVLTQTTPNARFVTSTGMLAEERHFRLNWSTPQQVGVKAAVQNFADIESMDAHSTAMLFIISALLHTPASVVTGTAEGLWQEGKQCLAELVGGDMVSRDSPVISISTMGELGGLGRPLLYSVARARGTVIVSERIGYSAAGLALLQHCGSPAKAPRELAQLVAAHCTPEFEHRRGVMAWATGVRSLMDSSDGLMVDLCAIVQASRVILEVDSGVIALDELQIATGGYLGIDLWEWMLTGGEDYTLIGLTPGGPPTGLHAVGTMSKEKFDSVFIDGKPPARDTGWVSF